MIIRKICVKIERITTNTTGHWTFAWLGFNKESLDYDYELRAHAELLNNDFPLYEGQPYGLKSITQLSLTCPSLRNENSQTSVGILTLDESFGEMEMKKWNESLISGLKSLSSEQLTDIKIAKALNRISANWNFTAMAVKRKRHRLGLLKKNKPVINKSSFYIKVSKKRTGLGFVHSYIPLTLVKRHNILDEDVAILRKNDRLFFSKINRVIRKDRPNDYYLFHIPYTLINSTRFNEEIVEYLGKTDSSKEDSDLIHKEEVDLIKLLNTRINRKIRISLHPLDKNKILIGTERISIPIELPRRIYLSEDLFQCLGLFQGEGSKGHMRRVEITNSDADLLNLFLNLFRKVFLVRNERWRARVIYTRQNKNLALERELVDYWSKKFNIPTANFVKTLWWKGNPNAINGSVQLYLPNSALREIWFKFLGLSYDLIKDNVNYAKWFLQGVLAADGCPSSSKGKLHSVMIRIENQNEGEIYQTAFKKLSIYSTLSLKNRSLNVYRQNEIRKVHQYKLFQLHKERNRKFNRFMKVMR